MNRHTDPDRSVRARTSSLPAVALLLLSLAALPPALAAQQPGPQGPPRALPAAGPGEIRGVVVDAESGAPIGSASVSVHLGAEVAPVAGAITRADGQFRIEGLRPGTYRVRVGMIGYAGHAGESVVVSEASPRVMAGSIRLARSAIAVEGVEVTADRATVMISPDRNAYRARDVAPAAATATDVLEAVPAVEVDPDGKVSLRGNENVVVQINGRPSPIRGAQLAAYLRQLPANTIERVEVIPNPSARQDPEGMAGIINLVMKQGVDLGTSGGLTLTASSADRYSASGNLGYQAGPVTAFASYGYNWDERAVLGINDRTRLGAGRAPLSYTEQSIVGNTGNYGHNLSANLDYRLGRRDVLSNAVMLNRRSATDLSSSAHRLLDGDRALLDRYDRMRDSETQNWLVDYTLAWKRTLEPQRHEISSELRFNRSADDERTAIWREPFGAETPRLDAELNTLDALTNQLTTQLDYTRGLGARGKLETGYRGNSRWLDRDFRAQVDPLGSGTWQPGALGNALNFDERTDAAYAVISHGAGPVQLQAGLRAEHTSRDVTLATSEESFPFRYTSLFPSGLVSYKLGDRNEVKLSYSRRIRRPGSFELNPFPNFFDAQNVFLGNPRLNPEYTDAIELGLQRTGPKGSLQLSPFYRRTTDIIRFVINTADTVGGREVTSISFRNLDTGTSWGADLNGSLRFGQRFNGFASVNVFKMVTDGSSGETSLSSDAVTWSARANGTVNLNPKTALQAMYFYRAPMNVENGRFSGASIANLSVRHKLQGDRAIATLRLSDPLNTMRFRVEAGDDRLIQLTERTFTTRALHLSLQYTFGRPPRVRQPRPEQTAEPSLGFP
jgi:ferric enterobactin receptor